MIQLSLEKETKYYVKESNIENAGLGLFAKETLPIGTRLEVVGFLIHKNSPEEVCTRYARDYRFYYTDDLMLVPTGWAGMANHSTKFNSVLLKIEEKLYLEMLRDIQVDEEIVYEYSTAAVFKMNVQSSGQAFAVVCSKNDIVFVKDVTANMAKALKKVESLKKTVGEEWHINVVPTKIDLQELKGNL